MHKSYNLSLVPNLFCGTVYIFIAIRFLRVIGLGKVHSIYDSTCLFAYVACSYSRSDPIK